MQSLRFIPFGLMVVFPFCQLLVLGAERPKIVPTSQLALLATTLVPDGTSRPSVEDR